MTSASVSGVKEAINALLKAITSNNLDELGRLTADELTFGHASGRAETKQEFIGSRVGKQAAYADIVPSEQRVALIDNVAVVHQALTRTRPNGHSDVDKEMVVWMLRNGQWQLISRQCVKPAKPK